MLADTTSPVLPELSSSVTDPAIEFPATCAPEVPPLAVTGQAGAGPADPLTDTCPGMVILRICTQPRRLR